MARGAGHHAQARGGEAIGELAVEERHQGAAREVVRKGGEGRAAGRTLSGMLLCCAWEQRRGAERERERETLAGQLSLPQFCYKHWQLQSGVWFGNSRASVAILSCLVTQETVRQENLKQKTAGPSRLLPPQATFSLRRGEGESSERPNTVYCITRAPPRVQQTS